MGKAGLVIAALCWAAPIVNWLGALLRRFKLTREPGLIIQCLAGVIFLLGVGGLALFVADIIAKNRDWIMTPVVLLVLGVPLLICAAQYYRSFRLYLIARRANATTASAEKS